MFVNNYRVILGVLGLLFVFSPNVHANVNMWGSGYYSGQWSCPQEARVSRSAVNRSDREQEERSAISRLNADLEKRQLELERGERKLELLRRRIDRYFDPDVVSFLLDTHIERANTCDRYQTHSSCTASAPPPPPADGAATDVPAPRAPTNTCADKEEVYPAALASVWNTHCGGDTAATAGTVKPSVCSDLSLRPTSVSRNVNSRECVNALAEYRREQVKLRDNADRIDRIRQDIEDREFEIDYARAEADIRRRSTESDCDDCGNASRGGGGQTIKRDWVSTIANVGAGLGMMYLGKRVEQNQTRSNQDFYANYGMPAPTSGISYGYPFYQAGMSGVLNGLVGPGAYGCASTYGGGGSPFGASGGWSLGGSANGMLGPFGAQGGAFGYPQYMYGSPMGGGMYTPGMNPYGMMNGPYGGIQMGGQLGLGIPGNGMAMCITYPCNVGGMGMPQYGMGGMGGIGMGMPQYGLGGQFGMGMGMPQYGMGGMGGIGMGMPQYGLGGQFGMGMGMPQYGMGGMGGIGMGLPGMMGSTGLQGQLSSQYQMQMLQQQQQMQMQYYQQQQQYYQAQLQQQMQMQQQAYQRQQQSMQIQQQIAQLNMQLQQLQMQSYYGTGYTGVGGLAGGINFGIGIGGGAPSVIGVPGSSTLPGTMYPGNTLPGTTLPGTTLPGTIDGGIRGR